MALPLLVGGSDCGPVNPLQALSKRLDQDRGLQQDHFGAGRAGPSRETFRSTSAISTRDETAAGFFTSDHQLLSPSAYDLSAIHAALPPVQANSIVQAPKQAPVANWAADFMLQQPVQSPVARPVSSDLVNNEGVQRTGTGHVSPAHWNPIYRASPMSMYKPMLERINAPVSIAKPDESTWDKEFQSQANLLASSQAQESQRVEQPLYQPPVDSDELSRTAGLLLETVKHEENPKFKNSQFLGLMKQLRDREMIIRGNEMVQSDGTQAPVDVKGKARAVDSLPLHHAAPVYQMGTQQGKDLTQSQSQSQQPVQENENDAYFRQENEDYIQYWNRVHQQSARNAASTSLSPWDKLQADWDQFEATATGIKQIDNYQFQLNNPYLLGDASTRHHMVHTHQESVHENVLALEAAVQRDMTNADAWYQLGVKQQENEREQKAIQALRRAVDLDPSHLPTWLALAISYTNDNNRLGTYNAIKEWVDRNTKYSPAVSQWKAQNPENANVSASMSEQFGKLIQCLIAMATSGAGEGIDADIQVALAVLLNTDEDYVKAQDCFRTALAVRPDDWQLYNRVGATLANSGRAEDALQYYYRALELNPSYIRARFNLGISCINLRRYEEAAGHVLDALALQENDGVRDAGGLNEKRGVTSMTLWDSLKTACLHMQRVDLATLCDRQDLDGFRAAFMS